MDKVMEYLERVPCERDVEEGERLCVAMRELFRHMPEEEFLGLDPIERRFLAACVAGIFARERPEEAYLWLRQGFETN